MEQMTAADKIRARSLGIDIDERYEQELERACRVMPQESVERALRQGLECCHRDWSKEFQRANDAEGRLSRFRWFAIGTWIAIFLAAISVAWTVVRIMQ